MATASRGESRQVVAREGQVDGIQRPSVNLRE
jgi:hypothetical protein